MASRKPPPATRPRLIDTQMRVILPQEVVDALKVKEGDYVAFTVDSGGVHLRRVEWVVR